eukprot:TRINITY_DN4410_c0_g1_i1.p1 TRINITY_DN4410_c0_g1~~TRINITY_DN4410_c0_g1_i1.p1  ORF type:complete len:901 (-),score=99.16 TRINITY_DN4410_c0_g1_i1:119-2821(-)
MAAVAQRPPDMQSLILACNRDGMESLKKGQLETAFQQFKYAETVLIANEGETAYTSLLAATCNNLGLYYKKTGKLHGALSYLRRALRMEVDLDTDEITLAGTHLNICAILSKLQKHDKAVQHAECALDLVKRRVAVSSSKEAHSDSQSRQKVSQDDYSVLAVAYHNVAVERDFLREADAAAAAFKQGFQVAKQCLGEDHPLSITLGASCDAVLTKSRKAAARPVGRVLDFQETLSGLKQDSPVRLPGLPAASPRGLAAPYAASSESWRQRTDPVERFGRPDATWSSPGTSPRSDNRLPTGERLPPLSSGSKGPGSARQQQNETTRKAGLEQMFTWKLPPKSSDETPAAVLDAIESTYNPHAVIRHADNDCRPNRCVKAATRTSRYVKTAGMTTTTRYRDEVIAARNAAASSGVKEEYRRQMAAERIQRTWRAWQRYCLENQDWMQRTWLASTIIQSHWRSYHIRRRKRDRAATSIQRHVRGMLVRKALRRHRAAVAIQRHVTGMLTRKQLRRLQVCATKINSLVRGFMARRRVRRKRAFMTHIASTIQRAVRQMIARRKVGRLRLARYRTLQANMAATDIQRLVRGVRGRVRARVCLAQYIRDLEQYNAATKLQAMMRKRQATERVDAVRREHTKHVNKSATCIQRYFKGFKARTRYVRLRADFLSHEGRVRTIQRYTRGFLVRNRMWKHAFRAEEQLWAAIEIQRLWRGYVGRVRWESAYENMWRREMAAFLLQRNIRGWLARAGLSRMRRRLARAEFEHARLRFKSAQRIQALVRGVQSRQITRVLKRRKNRAAVEMQRIFRGFRLRKSLWRQVVALRVTMIQAAMRGFLVRTRRFHLTAVTITIQRRWRLWRKKPDAVKQAAYAERAQRKDKAIVIQERYRKHREAKEIVRIQRQSA